MSKGRVLVTGACGYIGSHTLVDLIENGYDVIPLDNLSNSDGSLLKGVKAITGQEPHNRKIDLCDKEAFFKCLEQEGPIDGIIHFAALKYVNESVEKPLEYHRNNLESLLNVLEAMERFSIKGLVFSSSCSVYGDVSPEDLPVTEKTPLGDAASPYARTKQIGEGIINDVIPSIRKRAIILRYFNPVGAHPSNEIGEKPFGQPQNLLPRMARSALGQLGTFVIAGSDYPTRDGTCIRDYVHVMDIAHAHTLALDFQFKAIKEGETKTINLGSGSGYTVKEMLEAFIRDNDLDMSYEMGPRRPGDVTAIYSDSSLAEQLLGWTCCYSLKDMVTTAWAWERELAN
jgi:UDP-glucose 4-epimerase